MSTSSLAETVASLIQQQGANAARAREQTGQVWGGAIRDVGNTVQQTIATITDPKRKELQRQQEGRTALAQAIKTTPAGKDGAPDHQGIVAKVNAAGFPDIGEAYLATATKNDENLTKLSDMKRNAAKAVQDLQAHQMSTVGDAAFHADSPEKFTATLGYLAAHGQLDEQQVAGILQQTDAGGPEGWKAARDKYLQFSPEWQKHQDERNKPIVLPPTPRGAAPATQVVDGKVVASGAPAPPDPTLALTEAQRTETARHNQAMEAIGRTTAGRESAAQAETARHNREMEKAANPFGGAAAGATGAAGPTGDDFLKTLAPNLQPQVKALAEGRQPFPTGMAYSKLQPLIQLVTQYDPTFDAANYTARSKARSDLTSPNGVGGKTINSLNTAIQHLGRLSDLIEALDNGNIPLINSVANYFSKQTGSTKVTNFDAVQPQAMKEIERLWRGAGGSEGDINALKESLSHNMGKQQQREALQQFVELVRGKLDSTEQQRDNVLGPVAGASVPVLFDQAKPVLEKIAQRAAGEQSGAGPKEGTKGTVNGRAATWKIVNGKAGWYAD